MQQGVIDVAVSESGSSRGRQRPARGRPPKGAPQLSRASIVAAALDEIEADGPAGLSMRSVARRLGVDPKSLYNHVDGKDGLLDAVAGHVLATTVLPEPTGDLAVDIRAFAQAFRTHALSRPRAATLVLTRQASSRASLVPVEAVLALLVAAGLDDAQAVRVLRAVLATVIGLVLREADAGPSFGTGDVDAIARRRTVLEESNLPHVAAAAGDLACFDADAEFDYTIELVVRTITAQRVDTDSTDRRPAADDA